MHIIPIGAIIAGLALTSACASYVQDVDVERSTTVLEEDATKYITNLSIRPPRDCDDTIVRISGTTRFNRQTVYLSGPQHSNSMFLAETDEFTIESLPLSVPRTDEEVYYIVSSALDGDNMQTLAYITVDERSCL